MKSRTESNAFEAPGALRMLLLASLVSATLAHISDAPREAAAERVPHMRLEQLMQKRGLKIGSAVPTADRVTAEDNVQRPRTFYRRELEARPLVIAKP